ncbi:Hypothetical protein, putative [Bodo saltans]|uniref:Uncharacterized protein n=1 Tax=Bodo saltans TaxID=75058 RepID=A0A0S4J8M6_BODSA|nr:Hypothetical protein, putative [Bodo saltans]|eukprot:CUG87848.1 Hypothetical protein, putative [Bodo saltans]
MYLLICFDNPFLYESYRWNENYKGTRRGEHILLLGRTSSVMSARRLRPTAERSDAVSYEALKDPHLEEYYARRADVRWNLAELGLVTTTRRVVDKSEDSMRLVDRALAVLERPDAAASREAAISARGDRISKHVESSSTQSAARQQQVLSQYAKERLRRAEKKEKQQRFASSTTDDM